MDLPIHVDADTDPLLQKLAVAVQLVGRELGLACQSDLETMAAALYSIQHEHAGVWSNRDRELTLLLVKLLKSSSLNAPAEPILELRPELAHFQTAGLKGH